MEIKNHRNEPKKKNEIQNPVAANTSTTHMTLICLVISAVDFIRSI